LETEDAPTAAEWLAGFGEIKQTGKSREKTLGDYTVTTTNQIQCPLLVNCQAVSEITCTDRNFVECEFFRGDLVRFCGRIGGHCERCRYYAWCRRPEKKPVKEKKHR
jgi:hypothetical protein